MTFCLFQKHNSKSSLSLQAKGCSYDCQYKQKKKIPQKTPNLTYQSLGDVYFATAMMLILYFISERDNLNHSRPCHFNAVLVFQPSIL